MGYCAEDDERGMQRLLIYEFMPNGSVEDHLSVRSQKPLSWAMRLKIALDAARGLTYLHEEMASQVFHCVLCQPLCYFAYAIMQVFLLSFQIIEWDCCFCLLWYGFSFQVYILFVGEFVIEY